MTYPTEERSHVQVGYRDRDAVAAETDRVRPLPDAISRIGKASGVLAESLSELEQRLESVLGPSRPTADGPMDGGEKSAVSSESEFTSRINSHAAHITSMNYRVRALLDRLET